MSQETALTPFHSLTDSKSAARLKPQRYLISVWNIRLCNPAIIAEGTSIFSEELVDVFSKIYLV